jgi:hypothetical protein
MGLLVWTDFSRLLNTVGPFKTIELTCPFLNKTS